MRTVGSLHRRLDVELAAMSSSNTRPTSSFPASTGAICHSAMSAYTDTRGASYTVEEFLTTHAHTATGCGVSTVSHHDRRAAQALILDMESECHRFLMD